MLPWLASCLGQCYAAMIHSYLPPLTFLGPWSGLPRRWRLSSLSIPLSAATVCSTNEPHDALHSRGSFTLRCACRTHKVKLLGVIVNNFDCTLEVGSVSELRRLFDEHNIPYLGRIPK